MAIVTRRFVARGVSQSDLSRLVALGSLTINGSQTWIEIQYDDAVAGTTETLDELMAMAGFAFDAAAGIGGVRIRSADGVTHNLQTNNAGLLMIDGVLSPNEPKDLVLTPEGLATGNSTRATGVTLDGSTFIVRRGMTFDRIILRVTAQAGGGAIRVLLFQSSTGESGSGPVPRIASISSFAPGATGNFVVALDAPATIVPGIVYLLYGRESAAGSVTLRTRTVSAQDLLNQNVDVNTHATTFTTALSSTGALPATFDPRQVPTGQATASALDIVLGARLFKS